MKYYEIKHLQKILKRFSLCWPSTTGHGACPVGVVCTPVRLHWREPHFCVHLYCFVFVLESSCQLEIASNPSTLFLKIGAPTLPLWGSPIRQGWNGQWDPGICSPPLLQDWITIGSQVGTTTPDFLLHGFWSLNSDPHACKENTLLSEPFPQAKNTF